jgi:LysM repeat protein
MFGTTVPTGGIFADWFTGELKEPVGEPLIFYTTITEVVRAFTFDKGILTAIEMRKSDYAKELEEKEQSSRSNHVLRVSAATSGNAATPQIHVVRQGDTLFGIARRYGVSVKEIIQANDMMNPDVITVGQAVVIPQETRTMQNKPSATP